jgi:hypothetical protein
MRPDIVTAFAKEVFGHTCKARLARAAKALGFDHVRTVESSGAWWFHNGPTEVLVTFGGPYQMAAAAVWRLSGGPTERI